MKHSNTAELSLAMHLHLAGRLSRNPERLKNLQVSVEKWLAAADCPGSASYLQQWLDAIAQGPQEVIALATDLSEKGRTLRSCSPFGALWESPQERWEFIKGWRIST